MSRYSPTERIGVNEVEKIVLNELGWIFREQPIEDMGIDAHLERVDKKYPTGKLIAIQIKTGESHFSETKDSFVYYGKLVHLDYWTGHSLPVILVAHFPKNRQTLWVAINESTVERTPKAWKVSIPKSNIFRKAAIDSLSTIFEGTPAQQKQRKLSIDEPLMRHIENGGKVSIALEEWINKSLGRSPIEVFIYDENGNETLSREWFQYYTGHSIQELACALFPWADVIIDSDFYEEYEDENYDDDWRAEIMREIDEDDRNISSGSGALYPYTESAGEVEYYRLELRLNELGKSFLILSNYLTCNK